VECRTDIETVEESMRKVLEFLDGTVESD